MASSCSVCDGTLQLLGEVCPLCDGNPAFLHEPQIGQDLAHTEPVEDEKDVAPLEHEAAALPVSLTFPVQSSNIISKREARRRVRGGGTGKQSKKIQRRAAALKHASHPSGNMTLESAADAALQISANTDFNQDMEIALRESLKEHNPAFDQDFDQDMKIALRESLLQQGWKQCFMCRRLTDSPLRLPEKKYFAVCPHVACSLECLQKMENEWVEIYGCEVEDILFRSRF